MSLQKSLSHQVDSWLNSPIDENTKNEIRTLKKNDPKQLAACFSHPLHFGTGGVRAEMGLGPSHLNIYTIQMLTQGLANYLATLPYERVKKRVVVCFDTRHHSEEFAQCAAAVLAGNGIEAYLFSVPRPTPYLSFSIPHFHAVSGIMITASHNPPIYNGYKVYWQEGGQVVPPHDTAIIDHVQKIESLSQVKKDERSHLITTVDEEFDQIYLEAIHTLQISPDTKKTISIVYTPLHGTGHPLTGQALEKWGFHDLSFVKKQLIKDGSFPTVPFPNPEENSTFTLGAKQLIKENKDLLIATDPDADRVGVVINYNKKPMRFTGNQIACLLLHYIIKNHPSLPTNAAFVKTIVTTELFSKICQKERVAFTNVLTGFKYIAEKIREWEQDHSHTFIFGAEESCGYLYNHLARDKDGVLASCLVAEAVQYAKDNGHTLYHQLLSLYENYGIFREGLHSIHIDEMDQVQKKMDHLRQNPPKTFGQLPIVRIEDYLKREATFLKTGQKEPLSLPKSNVLLYWLKDETKIVIRPSGTEPKVKFYVGVTSSSFSSVTKEKEKLDDKVAFLLDQAVTLFS
jgi:phosphomannomutase